MLRLRNDRNDFSAAFGTYVRGGGVDTRREMLEKLVLLDKSLITVVSLIDSVHLAVLLSGVVKPSRTFYAICDELSRCQDDDDVFSLFFVANQDSELPLRTMRPNDVVMRILDTLLEAPQGIMKYAEVCTLLAWAKEQKAFQQHMPGFFKKNSAYAATGVN